MGQTAARPNILWISCEDSSPQLGCYGYKLASTPNIDALAAEGVRFTQAHSVIGVCAPSRSSIITGMYPNSIGTHHMRCTAKLPEEIRCFPEYLRKAGYYCTNNAKTDYNFQQPKSVWDESSIKAHWKNRPANAPFFAVFNLLISHESHIPKRGAEHLEETGRLKDNQRRDPSTVNVPPYYPDTPEIRRDLANVYENVTQMDYQAGDLLRELEDAGLKNDTIVFFWSDHGVGLPRSKRWLYNSSTNVPVIVRIPEKFRNEGQGKPASVDPQLVSLMDLGPTVLNLAGLPKPGNMQGRAFLGANLAAPRTYIYGARDRMDERYDMVRMISDGRFRYIRNFDASKPLYQFMNTAEQGPTMKDLRRIHNEHRLKPVAERYFQTKPLEELYETPADPDEIKNLATVSEHKQKLEAMRAALLEWMRNIGDLGLIPEPELVELEKKYGSRAVILKKPENTDLLEGLLALEGAPPADLLKALAHKHASIRARAASHVANLRQIPPGGTEALRAALKDDSAAVRIGAAFALAKFQRDTQDMVGLLAKEMSGPNEWARLAAAQALDELGMAAKTAKEALHAATEDENQYVGRVAKHAENLLLGKKDESE